MSRPDPVARRAPRRWLRRWSPRALRRRATEAGYAAIMVAIIVPVMGIGCAAVAVDVGFWYVKIEQVQKAADAAALAGVPYLPQDLPKATDRAKEVAARNGYDGVNDNTVTVSLGERPTQLQVTISQRVENQFGSVIGVDYETITRTAVADYQGPAPMGSPCNTFGNEPDPGSGGSSATPVGTAHGASTCSRTPSLWGTVEGPETGKVQGDRYQTKKCENTGVDGCSGTTNDEYDDFGYVFVVKVQPADVGKTIDLQLYDPMFVNTGQDCSQLPKQSDFGSSGNANPYVTNAEAKDRYVNANTGSGGSANATGYCTGDSYPGAGSGANPRHELTTSFILRGQTDTQNPKIAPVLNDTVTGQACIKQYGSYNTSNSNINANVFKSGSGSYNADVAQTFHNWVSFCRFVPPRDGDYYLQVRTNRSLVGSPVAGGAGKITTGNASVADPTGNTTSGEGSNSFSVRAVAPTGFETGVSVSGYNHMPIYINAPTANATFYLIRVLPGAAGQKISFSYFDAGDAAGNGQVKVLTPTDATGSITSVPFPGGCTAEGGSAGVGPTDLTDCTAPFVQSGGVSKNNGKTETITIPIPTDYSCDYASFTGCWYKVNVTFANGAVHDVTTWNATVEGDPVRIVK